MINQIKVFAGTSWIISKSMCADGTVASDKCVACLPSLFSSRYSASFNTACLAVHPLMWIVAAAQATSAALERLEVKWLRQ